MKTEKNSNEFIKQEEDKLSIFSEIQMQKL